MISGVPPSFLPRVLLEVLLRDPRAWSAMDVETVEKRIIAPALRAVHLPEWKTYGDAKVRAMEIILGDSRNVGQNGNPTTPDRQSYLDKMKELPEIVAGGPDAEVRAAAWLRTCVTRAVFDWLDYEGRRQRGLESLPGEHSAGSSEPFSPAHLPSFPPAEVDAEGALSVAMKIRDRLVALPVAQRLLVPALLWKGLPGGARSNACIGEPYGIAQQRVAEAEHALIATMKAEFFAHDVSRTLAFNVLEHLRLLYPVTAP